MIINKIVYLGYDEEICSVESDEVNELLENGWRVGSITPQNVSVSSNSIDLNNDRGGFLVVLEKMV